MPSLDNILLKGIDDLLDVIRKAGMPEDTIQKARSQTRESLIEEGLIEELEVDDG